MSKSLHHLYSGVIYDAMHFDLGLSDFVLDPSIRLLGGAFHTSTFVGPAFTCQGEPLRGSDQKIKDHIRIEMLKHIPRGSVQVIDGGDSPTVAHFGDISGLLASKAGAVGVIINGNTRDVHAVKHIIPIACRGTIPVDAYGQWQISSYQVPLNLPGPDGRLNIIVNPGDVIHASEDGVLVLPRDQVSEIERLAILREQAENAVRAGLADQSPEELYEEHGRW